MLNAGPKIIAFPSVEHRRETAATLQQYFAVRRQLANAWLRLPAEELARQYASDTGKTYRELCSCGLQYQNPPAEEMTFGAELRQLLATESSPPAGVLLAAQLYLAPHEFPRIVDLLQVPAWLRADHVACMLTPPPLFRRPGESDIYRRFMADWMNHLQQVIAADPRGVTGAALAQTFGEKSHFHSLYFNNGNVRDLFKARAKILECSLEAINYELDRVFADRTGGGRIRLGVLAADFAPRTETFVTLPVFRELDRTRFEITLFALRGDGSAMETLCAQHADRLAVLPANLLEQVQLIRDADLDLIFIGANVTAAATDMTALVLHRLARIQMTGICCCVTTGMRNVDLFLSGTLSEPADGANHYTEKLELIDGTAHCFDFGGDFPKVTSRRPDRKPAGIPEDVVVFASGANFHKIVPELLDAWLRILSSVPDSRLVLYPFNPNWDGYSVDLFMTRLADSLRAHDIDLSRVVVLEAAPTWQAVVQRLQLADIYLDSFPFCGATSLLDALLAQLPIVAMDGTSHRTIQGAAILRSLDLGELVAKDANAYVKLAIRLAANRGHRKSLAKKIRAQMRNQPQIFDYRGYAKKAGRIFEQVWQAYCNRQSGPGKGY